MKQIVVSSLNPSSLFKINLIGNAGVVFVIFLGLCVAALLGGNMSINGQPVFGVSGFLKLSIPIVICFSIMAAIIAALSAASTSLGFFIIKIFKKRAVILYVE